MLFVTHFRALYDMNKKSDAKVSSTMGQHLMSLRRRPIQNELVLDLTSHINNL